MVISSPAYVQYLRPAEWLSGYIGSIFKKSDTSNPSNYTGMITGKLFNTIINEQLSKFFTEGNVRSIN